MHASMAKVNSKYFFLIVSTLALSPPSESPTLLAMSYPSIHYDCENTYTSNSPITAQLHVIQESIVMTRWTFFPCSKKERK